MPVQPNLLKGSLYALTAFLCMAIFGVFTKAASAHGGDLWVSFGTYLTGLLVLLPFVYNSGLVFFKTQHFSYHFGRAAFGLSASLLYMFSMHTIPIVNATLLFNTVPIFLPILAMLFLKATVSKQTWYAIGLGFLGIIIIIRPTEAIVTQAGDLLGLTSGVFLAVAYLLIKQLTPTDPAMRITFYFFLLATCMQVFLLPFAGPLPEWSALGFAALAGLAFVLAQACLAKGYLFAKASQVGVYQYTSLVYVGIIDWVVWDVVPPTVDLLGVLLVLVAAVIIIRSRGKEN